VLWSEINRNRKKSEEMKRIKRNRKVDTRN
jgi:hypothetical protein